MASPTLQDLVEEALGLLPSQWSDKDNMQGLVKSIEENVQVVEDQNYQILQERGVYTAVGVQLDNIGLIVGVSREGRFDPEYRQAILARIATNTSDGTPEAVRTAVKISTLATKINMWDHFPANLHILVNTPLTHAQADGIKTAMPAGVSLRVMFDEGNDSFIAADLLVELSRLALENDDLLQGQELPDLYNFELQTLITSSANGNSYLPDLIDTELINPLADTLVTSTLNQGILNL